MNTVNAGPAHWATNRINATSDPCPGTGVSEIVSAPKRVARKGLRLGIEMSEEPWKLSPDLQSRNAKLNFVASRVAISTSLRPRTSTLPPPSSAPRILTIGTTTINPPTSPRATRNSRGSRETTPAVLTGRILRRRCPSVSPDTRLSRLLRARAAIARLLESPLPPRLPSASLPWPPREPSASPASSVSSASLSLPPSATNSPAPASTVDSPSAALPATLPATPIAPPGLASETRRFRQRRGEEGDETFARGLYLAIRNDQRMRNCRCGSPAIFSSREEAEKGTGHLRFFLVGEEKRSLRVLQRKDDFEWHCRCRHLRCLPEFKSFLNKNGKRRAEDGELDLLARIQESPSDKRAKRIERIVSAATEPPTPEQPVEPAQPAEQQQEQQTEAATSNKPMLDKVRDLVNRAVTAMGAPITTVLAKMRHTLGREAFEAVDTRREDPTTGSIVVKRLKRYTAHPSTWKHPDDGFENLVWVDDPRKRVGRETIDFLVTNFKSQIQSIKEGNLIQCDSIEDIEDCIDDATDISASIGLHLYRDYRFGPVDERDPPEKTDSILSKALREYDNRLRACVKIMDVVYHEEIIDRLKQQYDTPPRHLPLGDSNFRKDAMDVGRFLLFLREAARVRPFPGATPEALAQIAVDVNAVHKQEMVPSFIEVRREMTDDMPGHFPLDPPVLEDVSPDEVDVVGIYKARYPEPDKADDWDKKINPGQYKLISRPKGILKPSKEWAEPESPRNVATPQKKKSLSFVSPVSRFVPPARIPSKIMTEEQAKNIEDRKIKAEVLGDEHSKKQLEEAHFAGGLFELRPDSKSLDREMGLTHYSERYGRFIRGLKHDMDRLKEAEYRRRYPPRCRPLKLRRITNGKLVVTFDSPVIPRRTTNYGTTNYNEEITRSPVLMNPFPPRPSPPPKSPRKTLEEFFAEDDDLDLMNPEWRPPRSARDLPDRPEPPILRPRDDDYEIVKKLYRTVTPREEAQKPEDAQKPEPHDDTKKPAAVGAVEKPEPRGEVKEPAPADDVQKAEPSDDAQEATQYDDGQQHAKSDDAQESTAVDSKEVYSDAKEVFVDAKEVLANDDDVLLQPSIEMLEQLHLDRQIEQEFRAGVLRQIEEKKRLEEERRREEQRRLEEERRRQEEERRRQEEERLREEAARRQREADEEAARTGLRAPNRPLITDLSGEWDNRVTNAARANPNSELCKTLEGQPLTRRDFEEKLLPPTAWLNDNVIIGNILYIADYVNTTAGASDQEPKCSALTSYFWPRLMSHGPSGCGRLLRRAGLRKQNFLDIDTVLIPICEASHWTLAVIRPSRRTVSHLDSMRAGRGHESVKGKLLELVKFILEDRFVEDEWSAVEYEAPLQTNGWDCGVFTITNAICLALGLNPKLAYRADQLTLQRRRLAAVLLNEGFKGDFSLDGF
ncbi:hypothetical protein VTJ49DRAFT_4782 [Mycothermus thermophilus]|uniref:Ubiquitin-like protease family profile domain-containing protein n=1 Tax=Humicola insolens TaxID=85995 RepID=A0ABR3VLM1_HUMIN